MKNLHLRPPTMRQTQCLAAIASSLMAFGRSPSYFEIAVLLKIRNNHSVREYLRGLDRRGLVVLPGKGRGGALTLTPAGMRLALNQKPCETCCGSGRVAA